ncbi:hypothetical protein [Paenibacillus sp. N3/727]|nr:hypothetical protein [Paenibacillus sp. N3/727]
MENSRLQALHDRGSNRIPNNSPALSNGFFVWVQKSFGRDNW